MDARSGRSGSIDQPTVEGFGYEWTKFDQSHSNRDETQDLFERYFGLFPWRSLPASATGIDLGCGSGRWARLVKPRVGTVLCVDASPAALKVAQRNAPGCQFVLAAAGALPLRPASLDFGYSLGVLHHIPDPLRGLRDVVTLLRPGAPFLVYLYYAFDSRPRWFRVLWRASDLIRRAVSRAPLRLRFGFSQVAAVLVYLPLARTAAALERRGRKVHSWPLAAYRHRSIYAMRTDALDRFGTRLERRFTRNDVVDLLENAGLQRVQVSEDWPYWCAVAFKPAP